MTRLKRRPGARPAAGTAAERRRATQELRALAHPLRLKLLEAFAEGPRTTMQVAESLGEPPTRLYHHVNALERAGILALTRTRQVRGTTEKYFEVAKRQIGMLKSSALDAGTRAQFRGVATIVFDEARRELLTALASPTGLTKETAPLALRMALAVPPGRIPHVRRRLMAAIKAIQADCKRHAGTRAEAAHWALTLVLAPRGSGKKGTPPPA